MNSKPFKILESTFEEVQPIWRDLLWPGRVSAIEPTNPLKFLGGYDTNYMNNQAVFYKAVPIDKTEIIGVISGHFTEPNEFRLRGIYVSKDYRSSGVAKSLITAIETFAKQHNCKRVWHIPRKVSFGMFQHLGYKQDSDWIDDEFEFGPNCFMSKDL